MGDYILRPPRTANALVAELGIKDALTAPPGIERGVGADGQPYTRIILPGVRLTDAQNARLQQIAAANGWGEID